MKSYGVTIQMKATEQYFPVVLFIMLYKVALTFESVVEILKCDHSNKSYWAVLSCGTVYYAVQGGSNFWVCGWNPKVWPFKWKLLSSTFLSHCLFCCTPGGSNFWVCGWNPKVWPFKWKLLSSTFLSHCLFCCTPGGSNFWVCGWNPYDHSFEWSYLDILN